ncbi:helix-turn-helix domain-containing protein [Paenibacillus sp. GCM10027626]|uniref:helix-turn-helix domain-containing protein n=1 Tax=Paenibacillus sp. GCM10027626 TaxID=3273411 RepID=UPI00363FAAAD
MANWGDLLEVPIRLEHLDVGYGEGPHGVVHKKTVPFGIIAQAVEGTYIVHTPVGTQTASDGHVFITPPNMPLEITHLAREGDKTMRIRFVHFRFTFMGTIDLFDLYDLPSTTDLETSILYGELIQQLVDIKTRENGLSFTYWAKKNELAYRLLDVLLRTSVQKETYESRIAVLQELQPLLLFIRDHLHEPLDIDKLLRVFPFSRSSMFTLFREQFGQTPMEYVKTVRLNEALRQICSTSLNIAEIADRTGFANSFHFSREFKARFGMPPTVARKEHLIWEKWSTLGGKNSAPTNLS